jgi:chromosome segregation protein
LYFKKLELSGFKSFAEKTLIQFEPGVTAIVGPNGCGKSNVSDSIRWVLGEQSAKSLRGASMEDIIFNGAQDREPLNFAEVSLTLSNETRILAVDYDEVTISRRLYRSGESEYLLNKNTVRLKDIHELLLGTGIGTESYSVIEQGKMDTVLAAKPEERRTIFEEAAGITKFKQKKKEALRKLEQTDQNLLRVNDIIQEVKRQISAVERQAKKAEQYKVEFEKMKKLELAVASREFLLFDNDRRTKEEELASLKSEEQSAHEAASTIEAQYQERRSELDGVDKNLSDSNAKEVMAQSEIRRVQDRILMNRERVGELIERKGNIAREIESIQGRLNELRGEFERLEKNHAAALEEEAAGARSSIRPNRNSATPKRPTRPCTPTKIPARPACPNWRAAARRSTRRPRNAAPPSWASPRA